jgi:hypothetical protein
LPHSSTRFTAGAFAFRRQCNRPNVRLRTLSWFD